MENKTNYKKKTENKKFKIEIKAATADKSHDQLANRHRAAARHYITLARNKCAPKEDGGNVGGTPSVA